MYYRRAKRRRALLPMLLVTGFLISVSIFLRELSTKIAVSDAADIVTKTVNTSISKVIDSGGYGLDWFVKMSSDENGGITAISSDMAHINLLSTEILNTVIESTDNGVIRVSIPLGNLTGINLLMGKGPDISVDIIMLTSSRVDFKSEISPCGINQANYRLLLEITVDVDVIVPWGTESAETVTEVIVADTVIIGKTPDTYLNLER